jgi:hypothetical protein
MTDETEAKAVVVEDHDGGTFDVYKRMKAETGEDYWPVATLADYLGINARTLRAQAAAGKIPHPDKRARNGGLSLQLYSHEAALEVQKYYLTTQRPLKRRLDTTAVSFKDYQW